MAQFNLKNPSVKRIMKEVKEMEQENSSQYTAKPLEDNLFEWHFTIRGPQDTPFEGGIYHGRISLPSEYPFKPPNIVLLTPNGRFEVGKKICLSISAHHPEYWQPSWSVRTVLIALIGFMPTKGDGAIGALDYTPEERKRLAAKSKNWKCEICGCCNSNALPVEEESTSDETTSFNSETIVFHPEQQEKEENVKESKQEVVEEEEEEAIVPPSENQQIASNTQHDPSSKVSMETKTSQQVNRPQESKTFIDYLIVALLFGLIVLFLKKLMIFSQ